MNKNSNSKVTQRAKSNLPAEPSQDNGSSEESAPPIPQQEPVKENVLTDAQYAELLRTKLIDLYDRFDTNAKSTLASIIIAIGIVTTSDTAQKYLVTNPDLRGWIITSVIAMSLIHAIGGSIYAFNSYQTRVELKKCLPDKEILYGIYELTYYYVGAWFAVNLLAMSVFGAIVHYSR